MSEFDEDNGEPELPLVYSVTKDGLLVAYVRRELLEDNTGAVRRASGKEPVVLATFNYGIVDCFETKAAAFIAELAGKADSLDALLFELKLDGYSVHEGETKPNAAKWRF